jgi:hypothetical protein
MKTKVMLILALLAVMAFSGAVSAAPVVDVDLQNESVSVTLDGEVSGSGSVSKDGGVEGSLSTPGTD